MRKVGYINTKEELENAIRDCEGCIIYGAGLVGTCLIQYMIRERISSKIICIGAKSKEGNPVSIMGIPVCELKELKSYTEKYLFVIATLEHTQAGIREELGKFGCQKVIGISNAYFAGIRETVNDFTPDIMCAVQKGFANMYANFTNIYNKIDAMANELSNELIYLVEEQNEVSAVNTETFAGYRNCYRGREVVITATGSTLNSYHPIKGAVHIGVNTIYKNPEIPLDYLFVQDGRPEFISQGKFDGIENVKCRIFMGRYLKRAHSEYLEFPEEYRVCENIKEYVLDHAWHGKRIYRDICHHPVVGGDSVIFAALHFALYTCPKRIYLAGCDNAPTGYYDGTVDKSTLIDGEVADRLKGKYQEMKAFARMHYPETEIVSINPVGLKGIFQDVYQS